MNAADIIYSALEEILACLGLWFEYSARRCAVEV